MFRLGLAIGLAAAIALAWWYLTRPVPIAVLVRAAENGAVEATVANTRAGTVKACRRSRLSPTVGGRVADLRVRRGDRVASGALLLTLRNDDLVAQRHLAANAAAAAAAIAAEACLSADLAAREATRAERLRAEGVIDERSLDQTQSGRDRSAAACTAAGARVEEARARIRVVDEELAKTALRAPFAGIVAELNAELGEVVTPSPPGIPTPPAVDLIDDSCLYVEAPIDEVDVPRVELGQPARITLDAFPAREFPGTVRRIAPFVLDREKQARTVDIEVEFDDSATLPILLAGYSADVEVLLEQRQATLRIPTEAIFAGDRVLTLVDGRLVERQIERGLASWKWTEVLGGLNPREPVVLSLDRVGVAAGALAFAEPDSPR